MSPTLAILLSCHDATRSEIERSLLSLITQAGNFRLHVHLHNAGPEAIDRAPLLADWQARLGARDTRVQCRDLWFSYRNLPETGPADALREGLDHLSDHPDRFIGWLRPGDVLLPGALSHIADAARHFDATQLAWLQGAAAHMEGERLSAAVWQRNPQTLIRQGLCDGLHWPRVAQGGMVFRAGLWLQSEGHLAFDGDLDLVEWQLWRRFARHAPLVQSAQPLGIFAQPTEEAPPHRQVLQRRRMAAILPEETRLAAWRKTLAEEPLIQTQLKDRRPEQSPRIVAVDITPVVRNWALPRGLWSAAADASGPAQAPKALALGAGNPDSGLPVPMRRGDQPLTDIFDYRTLLRDLADDAPAKALRWRRLSPPHAWTRPLRRDPMWRASRLWVWDQDWDPTDQTEWASFRAVQRMGQVPHGTSYAGFPWASLITARQGEDAAEITRLQRDFDRFRTVLPFSPHRITACHHPDLLDHLDLLVQARVTDVFWTHATPERIRRAAEAGLRLHLLPRCPQAPVVRTAPEREVKRPVLLAEIGAPTEVLRRSKFALCRVSAGEPSPRLWRIIAAGAVPVILAGGPDDTLLPGPATLWQQGAVFQDAQTRSGEDLMVMLRTEGVDRSRMETREEALSQLWLAHGPDGLGLAIHALMARQADTQGAQHVLAAPQRINPLIRVYHLGPRAARSPLGYEPLARLAAGRIATVDTPEEADLAITGWNRDLAENPDLLERGLSANPKLRCMVISEEPLWDTVWSEGYSERDRPFDCGPHHSVYRYLNHVNSDIFAFEHLPYFLLTDDRYIPRYIDLLGKYARMRPQTLLQRWIQTVMSAAFVAERRDDPIFDVSDPERDITGLSRYRSQVAEAAEHPKTWRIGKGWTGHDTPRQELPDWHLEKLALLDGKVRLCAAYENTHLRSYVSEKVFDALAVGAIPVCYAAPDHRLFELVHPHAMLNTHDQPPETAASWVDWFEPEIANAEAWLDSVDALRVRLCDADALAAERVRVVTRTLEEIEAFL